MNLELENPIHLIRALKGPAISILFALAIARQNCGGQWLARITGYSINKTMEGLLVLQEYELVVRVDRYHWGLSKLASRLPLMIDNSILQLITGEDEGTRNNCESNESTASTTTIEGKRPSKRKEVVVDKSSRNGCESIRLLHEGGIGEPMASKLADLEWITPAYIKAHLQKGIDDQIEIGLVIHRMKYHDPAPLSREEQEREERKRFAKFFNQ